MTSYAAYFEEEKKKAAAAQAEYAAQERAAAELEATARQDRMTQQIEEARLTAEQQKKKLEQEQRRDTDAAEMARRIRERNIRERLDNLGLTGSGRARAETAAEESRFRTAVRSADRQYREAARQLSDKLRRYTETQQQNEAATRAQKENACQTKLSRHWQTLLTRAQNQAQSRAKAEQKAGQKADSASGRAFGAGTQGELTAAQLASPSCAEEAARKITESGDSAFLVQALQNTLKYTRISSARIAAWLVSLQIPTATRRQIAAAVGGDVLQQYLSLAREPVAGSNLRLGTVRRAETK